MQAITSGEKLTSVFRKTSFKIQGNAERGRPEGGGNLGIKNTTETIQNLISLSFAHAEWNWTNKYYFSPSLFISNSYNFCSQNQADDLLHFINRNSEQQLLQNLEVMFCSGHLAGRWIDGYTMPFFLSIKVVLWAKWGEGVVSRRPEKCFVKIENTDTVNAL